MEYSNAGMMRRTAVDMSVHSHDDSIALTQVIRGWDLQANPKDGRRGMYLMWNLSAKVEDLHNEQLAWYTMHILKRISFRWYYKIVVEWMYSGWVAYF